MPFSEHSSPQPCSSGSRSVLPHAEMEIDVMQVDKDKPQVVLVPLTCSTQIVLKGPNLKLAFSLGCRILTGAKSSHEGPTGVGPAVLAPPPAPTLWKHCQRRPDKGIRTF